MNKSAASNRSIKGQITKAATIAALKKESLIAGRLKTRSSAGSQKKALRKEPILTIKGVSNPRYREIHPADHGSLELPDYQRNLQSEMVNSILRALHAGGEVVDPITLSRRMWKDESNKANKYYIVDGQQRAMAHIEAGKPIKAILYDVESMEAERQLFVVLNTQKDVNANNIVSASSNKVAQTLREANVDPAHAIYGRVYFNAGSANGNRNMAASVIMRGLAMALSVSPKTTGKTVQQLMPVMDSLYDKERVHGYLTLIAGMTPPGGYGLRLLTAKAIGKVFAEKAEQYGHVVMPTKASIVSLRRVNWEKLTMGTWALKVLPILLEAIRERWKA